MMLHASSLLQTHQSAQAGTGADITAGIAHHRPWCGTAQVNKRKGEKYNLIWKDKPDFVRMAAKTNALIIPFAAVGGDDAFEIAMDTDEVLSNPVLGPLAKSVSRQVFKGTPLENSDDAISPITKLPGLGLPSLLPLPKLERLYFRSSTVALSSRLCVTQ